METACPFCGKKYKVADNATGKQARCSNADCKKTFTIGGAAVQPAAQPVVQSAAPAMPQAGAIGGSPLDSLLSAEMGAAPAAYPNPAYPQAAYPQAGFPAAQPGALGAAPAPTYRRRRDMKVPLIIGGAVGGLLLVVLVVVLLLMGGGGGGAANMPLAPGESVAANGLPSWAAFAVPPDATVLGYANIDKFRQSDLYRLIERLIKENAGPNAGAEVAKMNTFLASMKDAFLAGKKNTTVAVLRSRDDVSLETMTANFGSGGGPSGGIRSHAGSSYTGAGGGFVAKIGVGTYCFAGNEQDLKDALDRLQRKDAPPLGADLKAAWDASKGDHMIAVVRPMDNLPRGQLPPAAMAGLNAQLQWIGFGLSTSSGLGIDGSLAFSNPADAAKMKTEFDKAQATGAQQLNQIPPQMAQLRAPMEKMLNFAKAIRMSQSGNTVRMTASWSTAQIEDLVNTVKSMVGGMMGMGMPGMGGGRRPPGF